jgi:hypothetical protein
MNATSLQAELPSSAGDLAVSKRTTWQLLAVITVFWVYVTLSNVLYVRTLSAGIDPSGTANYFAPGEARVLQHLFLYPILVGCLWASLRVGWQPLWRAVPLQFLLSLPFAVLATPMLAVAENLISPTGYRVPQELPEILIVMSSGARRLLWISGTTNFELTYGFALALVTAFALYRRFKDSELQVARLERAWSEARLAALRAQLSPHTLFNLLHTIHGQIVWDPRAAQSMVVQLGDLLRGLLEAGEREFSPLQDELRFARIYLELQQKRYAERIKLSLPDEGAAPFVWVPSLILQPLVENAVVHGLAGHEGETLIELEVMTESDALILRVTNSVAEERASNRTGGIGLRNVRERLAVHFGDRSQLNAGLDEPRQWKSEIRLPLLSAAR